MALPLSLDCGTNQSAIGSDISTAISEAETATVTKDHFVCRDGLHYAGNHLLIDLWNATRLDDVAYMERVLRDVVDACGATLLHIHLHRFAPNGVSGVAVLAESHVSVHTWPERGFAAFDLFMCGDAQPQLAEPILRRAFSPSRTEVQTLRRGVIQGADHAAV